MVRLAHTLHCPPSAASLLASRQCSCWSHCTVWHLLSACPGLPLSCQPTLPDALKDTATLRHLRHQDSISVTEIVRMLARALRLNYQRFSFPFVPLITIGIVPATSSCLPQPCPWQLASYSSVHEPGRHVIGSAEQDIGVMPAWLGLVGEPVCVVESFQRGVDVVVVPT